MRTGRREPQLNRRDFLARGSVVAASATVAAFAPFSFVRALAETPEAKLHAFLEDRRRAARSPGLSAAVVSAHGLEWADGTGWANRDAGIRANADTVYMLASVSKTITCAGVMTVVEDGDLDLDADVNDVLPFSVHIPAYPNDPITLRQLLTHTSAIRDRYSVWKLPGDPDTLYSRGDSPIPLGEFLRSYLATDGERYRKDNFYDRAPGSKYAYCNIGVALAGYVAEVVTSTPFSTLCAERIVIPLGMEQSGFHLSDVTTPNLAMPYKFHLASGTNRPVYQFGYPDYPDGAFRTSGPQLAKWLAAFMNFGEFNGVRVLDEATVKEIRRNQHVASWHQGLVWWAGEGPGFFHMGHTGSDVGVRTRMFFRPDKRVGVITLSNSTINGGRYAAFRDVEQHLFDVFS